MKAIEPNLIKDNFIEIIGKEWMLVSAGDKDKFNMMTASWGGVGSFGTNRWCLSSSVRSVIPVNLSMKRGVLRSLSWEKNTKMLIKFVVPSQVVIWIKWRLQA